MSSVQLLDKTRKIGKLLHNNNSSKVVFNDICSVLCEILSSNVLVISKKGKVTIRRKQKKIRAKAADLSHSRKKRYILEEGVKVPFLQFYRLYAQ